MSKAHQWPTNMSLDSFIDEDAPPGAVATLLGTADDRIVVAAVGDRMVLTDSGFSMGLRLRLADFAGTVGTAIPVTGVTPLASDLCSQGDSAILALVRDGTGGNFVIEAFPLVLSPTRALLVGAVMFSWTTLDRPVGVAVESFGSSFAFAWDAASGARLVMSPAWAAPFELPSAGGPLDLATDGTNLVVPSDFNALTFLRPDGTLLGLVPIPGQLADAPLASSSASVVVGYRDTFDHVLARVTSAGAGPGHTAPAVGAGFPLRVDDTPLGVLVTRFDTILPEVGVAAQLLRPTLDATIATFPAGAVSAGGTGTPTSFDVVASSSGTAILTSFGSAGSVLTVLGCEPR